MYHILQFCYDEQYENSIILWPSENEDYYVRAIANYIKSQYEIDVTLEDTQSFDWKNEYLRMIRDIRSFVSELHEIVPFSEDLNRFSAKMDDVEDFGDEKHIWNLL